MTVKKPYERPILRAYGDIRAITTHIKDLGLFDGDFFRNESNPLRNVS
jgi:hypothetical protein